jgi:hypothetical protein
MLFFSTMNRADARLAIMETASHAHAAEASLSSWPWTWSAIAVALGPSPCWLVWQIL